MGIYSLMRKRIKENIEAGKLVIGKHSLTEGLDVSYLSREDLERRYLNCAASCIAYIHGYRSPIRGSGYFVDFKKIDDPILLHEMMKNSATDAEQKAGMREALKALRDRSIEAQPDCAQMFFDFDEDGALIIRDGITREDIIDMLERAANQ